MFEFFFMEESINRLFMGIIIRVVNVLKLFIFECGCFMDDINFFLSLFLLCEVL